MSWASLVAIWMILGLKDLKGDECIRIDEHGVKEGKHFDRSDPKRHESIRVIWQILSGSSPFDISEHSSGTTDLLRVRDYNID